MGVAAFKVRFPQQQGQRAQADEHHHPLKKTHSNLFHDDVLLAGASTASGPTQAKINYLSFFDIFLLFF